MSEIMRYDLDRDTDEGFADMIPISDGRYVEFEDFHRVNAERDGLQISLNTADQSIDELNAAISRRTHRVRELEALLTAADERADVLETALKKISARCVAYIEAEREMPEPSVEVCQMIASAALKPAEANDSCEFCKGWGFRTNPDGADEGCGACNGTGKEPSDDQP